MFKGKFSSLAGVLVISIMVLFAACAPKIDISDIKMIPVSNVVSISENIVKGYTGDTVSVRFDNTLNGLSISLDTSTILSTLTANINNDVLNIKSTLEGKYTIPIIVKANDKADTSLNIIAEFAERPIDIDVVYPEPIPNVIETNGGDSYSILVGTQDIAFEFHTDEDVEFSYNIVGDAFSVTPSHKIAVVSATSVGDAKLIVTASRDNTELYRKEIQLNAFAPKLNGGFRYTPDRTADLEIGQKLSIVPAFEQDGTSITVDVVGMNITRDGSGVALSTDTPGRYEVTVKANLDGYSEYTESFVLNVTPVKVPLTVSHKHVRVVKNETINVTLNSNVQPQINVSTSGSVKTSLNKNTLSITGTSVGNATVTITAKADGYDDKVIDIPVEITNPPLSLSFSENHIMTAYGKENSVSIVDYKAGDKVELSVVGDAKAHHTDGNILITLNSGNTATVLVTVQRDGYTPWSNQIKLAAKNTNSNINTSEVIDELYQQVLNEVNAQRAAEGLDILVYRSDIEPYAAVRAKEISSYWNHTRPDGRPFNTVFLDNGKKYRKVGENLAKGSKIHLETAKQVVDAWMGSPGHRANIMNAEFKGMAVSLYVEGNTYYWAQMFIVD